MSLSTPFRAGMAYPSSWCFKEVIIFLLFLMIGLVPPFSPFIMEVLEVYAIHMVYLVPNTIFTLALFAHARERFIGVQPSMELFRHFFSLCQSPSVLPGLGAALQARTVGGCYFQIHQRRRHDFIALSVRNKWEN
jgi:hypothetical protein